MTMITMMGFNFVNLWELYNSFYIEGILLPKLPSRKSLACYWCLFLLQGMMVHLQKQQKVLQTVDYLDFWPSWGKDKKRKGKRKEKFPAPTKIKWSIRKELRRAKDEEQIKF